MDQIAIDVVELQSAAARIESGPDPFWTVIGVPQLGGDEHVLPLNRPRLERFAQRITYLFFIAISFSAIEMSKPTSSAVLVACLVATRSGIRVPNPTTGIAPDPWLSAILE
jgi:hypothetical protein